MKKMTTLKEAIAKGKLKQFIKEREKDDAGDQDRFDATLESIAGKPKATQEASSQDDSEN